MSRFEDLVMILAPIYVRAHLELGMYDESGKPMNMSQIVKNMIDRAKQVDQLLAEEELKEMANVPVCEYSPHETLGHNPGWYNPDTNQCIHCGVKVKKETT